MKKIKFLFIALAIAISLNCLAPVMVYAEEEKSQTEEEEKIKKEKESLLALIDEYIDEINTRIIEADKKIDHAKEQKEFEYYPAIRLNVDTPMFGLSSIVENKLRVKKDISTSDVANKYSIRNIITNKKIRIPDSYLGAIVVSTKEYEINENMTLVQLKLTLVKCIQYLSQVNSVNEFMDTQINNIFKDYISENKKADINDIKNRVKKVSNQMTQISDKISKLEFLGVDVSEYKETYFKLSEELNNISETSKDTLILDSDLSELIRTSLSNESNVIDLDTKISDLYQTKLEDIDYELLLENVAKVYEDKVKQMNDYIEKSTTVTKEEKTEENEENKTEDSQKNNTEVKTTVNYNVTSNATLDFLKLTLEDINSQIDDNKKALEAQKSEENKDKEENSEDSKEKTEEQIKQEKQAKVQENSSKVDTLYSKYKEVISREYKFYTSNINMLLKDSNDKVSTIISEIDSGVEIDDEIFNYTKYIYLDLPSNLTTYIKNNNINSTIELENLINLLKNELNNLSNKNINITKLYNDISQEILKS